MREQTPPSLNIIEIFKSVQGETTLTGLPTTFIRLAACNLRCSWCDTSYSFGRGHKQTLEEIVAEVRKNGCRHVCVTGGEPLLQENVFPLISQLCDLGFILSIETGGSLPIDKIDPRAAIILDIKCPGSGMSHKNEWRNIDLLKAKDEVKFVILDREDYDYSLEICNKYRLFERGANVLLSPVFDKLDSKVLVGWMLGDNIPVRLNLQIHKFIWSPDTKGV